MEQTEKTMWEKLAEPMEYKTRPGAGGMQLAYIDARQVMDRLDEVVTPEAWQSDFKEIKGNVYAGIGIKVDGEWIWKWDVGTESNQEEEKGEASDSFKRAAVKWGIGRFLYSIKSPQKPPQKATEDSKPTVQDRIEDILDKKKNLATDKQIKAVYAIGIGRGKTEEEIKEAFKVTSLNNITFEQASAFIDKFGKKKEMNEDISSDTWDDVGEATGGLDRDWK